MAGGLVIADRVAANRVVLKVKLTSARYPVAQAEDAEALLDLASATPPDLVLLDVNLIGGDLPALCLALRRRARQPRLPILVTAGPDEAVSASEVLDAGADDLLRRPIVDSLLMARVRSLLRMRDTADEVARRSLTAEQLGCAEPRASFETPPRLMFIHPGDTHDTAPPPPPNLPRRTRVLSEEQALRLDDGPAAPELVVLSFAGPGRDDGGLPLLSDLRSRPATRHAAILALVPEAQPGLAAQALDLGASDVAAADAPAAELDRRIRRQVALKREADTLHRTIDDGLRIAATDALTGLHNRRYADYHLPRLLAEADSAGRPLAVILADIDHFKRINDTHGHATGDLVLREVGQRLRSALRGADLVARVGGEEFLAVLPDTDPFAASAVAVRLAEEMRRRPVPVPGETEIAITASFGVALCPPFGDAQTLLGRADAALYRAKAAGRDRVEFDPALGPTPPPEDPEPGVDQGRRGPGLRSEVSSRSA
jgi:two-component system cell cycle response regulator